MPVISVGGPQQAPQLEQGITPGGPTWDTTDWPVRSVLADSGAAWRVELDWPKGFSVWLPKSQCRLVDGWATIPGWLAREKGLPATNTEYPD